MLLIIMMIVAGEQKCNNNFVKVDKHMTMLLMIIKVKKTLNNNDR